MLDKAIALGMTEGEYQKVVEILGRVPTTTELAMYSVEWSEHCGYPRSRALLKTLPKTGHYASIAGADTGGIEIEPGVLVVFKMESHNHPSQIEPKQGAATGIGGCVRDIFTVGARPIACLSSLRFGELDTPKAQELLRGVADGISWYGNTLGVPGVAGEIGFNSSYRGNCLVGAMAVGVVKTEEIASAAAAGPGNSVMYFGNATGPEGIGGCSILASAEIEEDKELPTVQVGDPYTQKRLIEACLEAMKTGAIVGMKDMGAAGLTCTTCEMSAEGDVGMDIELDHVPLRGEAMEPYEIMMSESQERMLAVVEAGREDEVTAIFEKWDILSARLGTVTDDGVLRIRKSGEIVAEMTAKSLVDAPQYKLPAVEPEYLKETRAFDVAQIPLPQNYTEVLLSLLQAPNIASKEWVYSQYDSMVQGNTVLRPGEGDAAVLRIAESATNKGIALTADCNTRYCYLDPKQGAMIAIAEAARNLVCVGAEPGGVTDCLCFGNPDKPDRFWQFVQSIEGIVEACEAFRLPVVSGNVSFYNETAESVIHPSPLIGMVGVVDDVEQTVGMGFQDQGDLIVLIGQCRNELGGSEYLATVHGVESGTPPQLDLDLELNVQRLTLAAIRRGILKSAHDPSEGGLAVALAESCIAGGVGAAIDLKPEMAAEKDIRLDAVMFGETQSRIVASLAPDQMERFQKMADMVGVPITLLGKVGGEHLTVHLPGPQPRLLISSKVTDLDWAYRGAIARQLEQQS